MNESACDPRRDVYDLRQGDPDNGIAPEAASEDSCDDPVRLVCGAGNDRLLPKE